MIHVPHRSSSTTAFHSLTPTPKSLTLTHSNGLDEINLAGNGDDGGGNLASPVKKSVKIGIILPLSHNY
jgi:hypothetical protein